ncbi:MAG: hypothetical protein WBL28_07450 [Methylotenera sp.]
MGNDTEPMIKLDPSGKAPILSYNVPEPTSYNGRCLIELEFSDDYFKPSVKMKPAGSSRTPVKNLDVSAIKSAVLAGMKSGFADQKLFPNIRTTINSIRFIEQPNPGLVPVGSTPVSPKLAQLDAGEVASMMQAGKRLNIYKSMFGTLTHNYISEPTVVRPRILLVETYRLSSFLGSYGAGRTIKTFSLLPGEKTKISVKTYTKREEDAKSASSILDSFTQESSDNFEQSVQAEQSNTEKYAENFEYHAEAEASCSWGFGSAKVSGGVKGGSNSAREESAKNISSATAKHAAQASAKRDVQIETSYEAKVETGEETSVEREIQNVNLSRTLNFVFRQMNQEFVTLLHLVDVRVAFFNGFAESKREVALPELDSLLNDVIIDGKRKEVREKIVEQLSNIFDYQDRQHTFITEGPYKDNNNNPIAGTEYLRILKDKTHLYQDEATNTEITVPGIILSAKKYTMRTEGIIVDALLGAGEALDHYALRLQELEVARREAEVEEQSSKADRSRMLNEIIKGNDTQRTSLLEKLICPCGSSSVPLRIEWRDATKSNGGQ